MDEPRNPDNRKSYWSGRLFSSGPRVRARLFSGQDITNLSAIARKPLAHGVKPDDIARRLDLAFFGAHVMAEQASVELDPKKLTQTCKIISRRASLLLQALGLPPEPLAYTWKDILWLREVRRDPLMGSRVGARLKRAAFFAEPLPVLDLDADWQHLDPGEALQRVDAAILAAPLTDAMVPVSIAEVSYTYSFWRDSLIELAPRVNEHKNLKKTEAWLAVDWLLETAPSAIALLIALADQVAHQAAHEVGHKQNYRRTFRWALFHDLAAVYFQSFRSAPNILDKNRAPGPATKWAKGILLLASNRCERITAIKGHADRIPPEPERERLIAEIRATARLKATANRLDEGWHLFLQDHPNLASRKSR